MAGTGRRYRITVDTYACNGCETCVVLCPELFRISERSGKAEPLADEAAASEPLERAAASCPADCIELEPVD